jgi:branched-chain amino acid transport system permease protein
MSCFCYSSFFGHQAFFPKANCKMTDVNSTPSFPNLQLSANNRVGVARLGVSTAVVAVAIVALVVLIPLLGGRGDMRLAVEFCYCLALAQMWNFLAGYAGLISVGQQAYVGMGGYTLYVGTAMLGLHPLLAFLFGGLVAGLLSAVAATLLFRLQGAYFAIGTWVFAEIVMLLIAQIGALGSGSGVSIPAGAVKSIAASAETRDFIVYVIAVLVAGAATLGPFYFLRTKFGLALTAVRDNPSAAETIGIDIRKLKFAVYLVAGVFTGIVGGLIFLQKLRISPAAAFDVNEWSANIIFMVVIGGIGRLEGPIVGAIVFFVLREALADYGPWYLICLGVIAIFTMLFARDGLWGFITRRFGVDVLPVRREYRPGSTSLHENDVAPQSPN